MNDRGLNLTPTEMLKSYILSRKNQFTHLHPIYINFAAQLGYKGFGNPVFSRHLMSKLSLKIGHLMANFFANLER